MQSKVFLLATLARLSNLVQDSVVTFARLGNHVTYVTIIFVTEFKPEFQKCKAQKFNILT